MQEVGMNAIAAIPKKQTAPQFLGGKYLTFTLGGEKYGVPIMKIKEIIGFLDITPVPCTPDFVLGVINLRGKVIPVIDLKKKFGMPSCERTRLTCIIVIDIGVREMGIMVDTVSEVESIPGDQIEEAPDFGPDIKTEYILGMGKLKERVAILLNIQRVLTGEEIAALPEASVPREE
jgi:purine-binding chemotaxis protein CheW